MRPTGSDQELEQQPVNDQLNPFVNWLLHHKILVIGLICVLSGFLFDNIGVILLGFCLVGGWPFIRVLFRAIFS